MSVPYITPTMSAERAAEIAARTVAFAGPARP